MIDNFKAYFMVVRAQIPKIKIQNIFLVLFICSVYFALRLSQLTVLPIFADEAIYIRWAQVMRAEPTLRFLPLSDGKQPLFMWLTIPFLKLFTDPLFAGRLVSVLAGFASLIGIFLISLYLFKNFKIALTAAWLQTIIPFIFFFDRMALVDSLLSMWGIWFFLLTLMLARSIRLDLAMIAGLILGAALITKSPALFFAFLLPLTLLTVDWIGKKGWCLKLVKLVGLWSVVWAFGVVIYNFLLRLGPNFEQIASRNKDYVYPLTEIIKHPFDPLLPHLRDIWSWWPNLFTWPVFLLILFGIVWLIVKPVYRRKALFLLSLSLAPLLAQAFVASSFTPRYLLFTVWPLLVLGSAFVWLCLRSKNKYLWLIFLIFVPALIYDFQLINNPQTAPLPPKMRSGYLEEWTCGYGIYETAQYIRERSLEVNVLVGTEGFFGTLPDGLQLYLEKVARITVIGVGYPIRGVNEALVNSLIDSEVYLLVNRSRLQLIPEAYGLELVKSYPKAVPALGNQDELLLFRLRKDFWQERRKSLADPAS